MTVLLEDVIYSVRMTPRTSVLSPAPEGSGRGKRGRDRQNLSLRTLRSQFTLVIALLAFLPNLVLTLISSAQLTWVTFLWMLAVALLSTIIGYVLSGALLQPLHRLEVEVGEGDFDQFHRDDPREIRALRKAFGSLLTRLRTEQMRRSAFMATLVHDLKTPLIATGHLTQALTELPLPESERREVGRQIQAETARLLALVQQMADAHRYERDQIRLDCAPTDLRELLDRVARRLTPQAEARQLRLEVCGEGRAEVDAAALERAIGNLTENAVRYARHTVALQIQGHTVTVQDDGPGLSAPFEELAQPFSAQPTTIAGQQYTAGTAGLGLFIAHRIALAHGGELNYSRTSHAACGPPAASPAAHPDPALYTTFTLVLPEVNP